MSRLQDAVIASNSAQNIAGFEETSRITNVRITEQQICVDDTKRGQWPVISGLTKDPIEGSFWIFAEIDDAVLGGTFESKKANQECKALTPEEYGGTLATRMGPHIKQGPLADWVPQPGETIWVMVSTPARNDFAKRTEVHERSDLHETVWPGAEEPEPEPEPPDEPEEPDEPSQPVPEPVLPPLPPGPVPAPVGPTIEDIMSILTPLTPLIQGGFVLAGKALEHDTAKDAHDLALLELMTSAQREQYLDQIMQDRARRAKNLDWWQTLADNAGDLIDGDAWKRLRKELEENNAPAPAES